MDKTNLSLNLDALNGKDEPIVMAEDAEKDGGEQAGEHKLISIVILDLNNREIKLKVSVS